MRRALFIGLGVFELAAAGLLFLVGWQLPTSTDVERGFGRAGNLTEETVTQLSYLREQLGNMNGSQFGGLKEAGDGLGNLAKGMEAWANALDPDMIRQFRRGTRKLAGFLDEQVAPAAAGASGRLAKVTETFRKDALILSQLLKETPPDMKAAKEIYQSLAQFGEGLEKMSFLISAERLKTMREGFQGMEQSLETGAEQVERLSSYSYPVIKFNGLKPEIDEKPFWPEGDKIATGMRKGARAMREANKEFELQATNLPQIQRSLDESKKTVKTLRDMLGKAVGNQEKLDAVLKTLPENTAKLAEELPLLAGDLQKVLNETERLKEISVGLRSAQKLLEGAERSWPEARQGLLESAVQLRNLKEKIDQGLASPRERLTNQEQSLVSLSENLREVQDGMPAAERTVSGLLTGVRWLLWVFAGLLILHSATVFYNSRPAKTAAA